MAPVSLVLVLLSAFLHALWNALVKKADDTAAAAAGTFLFAMAATAALSLVLPGRAFPTSAAFWAALSAGLGEGGYFICLVRALERAPLGWTYAWMRGSAVVFMWPISLLLLGEGLDVLRGVSVFGLVVGLGLLGGKGGGRERSSALFWALLSGIFISGFNAAYKVALANGAQVAALFSFSMAVGVPVQLGERVFRHGFRAVRTIWPFPPLVWVSGAVCTTAFLAYLFALRTEGAGMVLTLRNVSVVFAMLMSAAMGERPGRRLWGGALLVTLGAMGLGWPRG